MPDPNEPLPPGGQVYTGLLTGTLEPITLPPLDMTDFGSAQRAASNAVRLLLGATGDLVDFHVIYRDGPNAPVARSRWRVQAVAGGPALRPGTAAPYPTTINYNLRVWPTWERLQVVYDPDAPDWGYRGVMAPIVPALILRHFWATVPGTVDADGARVLTIGSLGTARFTPAQMQFTALYSDQVTETVPWDFAADPLANRVASYPFAWPENQDRIPSVWLVLEGAQPYSRKISYATDTANLIWSDRWDDPDEPAPEFTPLDWPEEPQPEESLGAFDITSVTVGEDTEVPLE